MRYNVNTPSKLTFETYGVKYIWETDHSDLTLDEVLSAFYKLLIAHGFDAEGALENMKNFAEEELEIMESCKEYTCIEIPEDDISIHHTVLKNNNENT